ncbi:hypothetical protein [Natrinema longum]|uniref:hypothetical protein n=1 Tax=Natrinema longum TaxID=370324 RepID=UPI001CCA01DB|nr:hypothetical protein [Natrinema longum]MBZ6496856.1 hypothetical protein [Natrinema longum]
MTLEGAVAEVINEYRVVTNIGAKDGVEESHRYLIYSLSEPITDPETGDELGQIEYKKSIVHPVEIHDGYSIMESDESTPSIFDTQLSPMTAMTGSKKKLTSDPEFKHGDKDVEIGDPIKFYEDKSIKHPQAGVTVDGNEVAVTSLADHTAGVFCSNADIDHPDEIDEGVNGATSVGQTFTCDGDRVMGITSDGKTGTIKTI